MASTVPACYHADHAAAIEEIAVLASLLADMIDATTHGIWPARLTAATEAALQRESVRQQFESLEVDYLTR